MQPHHDTATEMNRNTGASGGSTEEMKEKIGDAASSAGEKVGEQLRSSATTGKSRAAGTLVTVADALSQSSERLRTDDMAFAGRYVDKASGQLRRASNYLRDNDIDRIVDDTESFARTQPALFIGGAFALGFLAARFIKASQREEHGDVPRERALVATDSRWQGDREAPMAGYREPDATAEPDTHPSYTRQFSRESL